MAHYTDLDVRKEKCKHLFEPFGKSVRCTYCEYQPPPEIIAVSLNALRHFKDALAEWPKTALIQFVD